MTRTTAPRRSSTAARTWPLWLLAAPAAVAIWGGWVQLAGLAGFGLVQPLPGLVDGLRIDSRITLPVGMEAYAALALRSWLDQRAPAPARRFARTSALVALGLGAAGQVAYHLMAAAGVTRAPWPVTALVACLPVAVLGMGAALAHLLRAHEPPESTEQAEAVAPAARPPEWVSVGPPTGPPPATPSRPVRPSRPSKPFRARAAAAGGSDPHERSTVADGVDTRARVAALLNDQPAASPAQVAARLQVSARTARRHVAALRDAAATTQTSQQPDQQPDHEEELGRVRGVELERTSA